MQSQSTHNSPYFKYLESSYEYKNFRTWLQLGFPPIYLHLIFDILEFEISSLMNWIFAGYTGSKNPVQTRTKIQFIILELSNYMMSKIKCR